MRTARPLFFILLLSLASRAQAQRISCLSGMGPLMPGQDYCPADDSDEVASTPPPGWVCDDNDCHPDPDLGNTLSPFNACNPDEMCCDPGAADFGKPVDKLPPNTDGWSQTPAGWIGPNSPSPQSCEQNPSLPPCKAAEEVAKKIEDNKNKQDQIAGKNPQNDSKTPETGNSTQGGTAGKTPAAGPGNGGFSASSADPAPPGADPPAEYKLDGDGIAEVGEGQSAKGPADAAESAAESLSEGNFDEGSLLALGGEPAGPGMDFYATRSALAAGGGTAGPAGGGAVAALAGAKSLSGDARGTFFDRLLREDRGGGGKAEDPGASPVDSGAAAPTPEEKRRASGEKLGFDW